MANGIPPLTTIAGHQEGNYVCRFGTNCQLQSWVSVERFILGIQSEITVTRNSLYGSCKFVMGLPPRLAAVLLLCFATCRQTSFLSRCFICCWWQIKTTSLIDWSSDWMSWNVGRSCVFLYLVAGSHQKQSAASCLIRCSCIQFGIHVYVVVSAVNVFLIKRASVARC